MDPFIKYLRICKQLAVNTPNDYKQGLHVILGNESCDLDSMISSLALGYLRYQENPTTIPVMNVTCKEFATRTENTFLLKKLDIDPSVLVFRDEIELDLYHSRDLLKLSLVDHHILGDNHKQLASSVVEIFDHRPIDPHFTADITATIKPVGSCATLIADVIFSYCNNVSNIMTKSLAVLLYSAIIFDTIAFSEDAGKTTELDTNVASKLAQKFSLCEPKVVYDELWTAHNDVSHLTVEQLLHKDLKIVNGVPIPGLPMLVDEFLKLPDVRKAMTDFCTSKQCNVMVVMGLHVIDGVVHRDLAVLYCSKADVLFDGIVQALKNDKELSLQSVEKDIPQVLYFKQCNVKLSRKYIMPLVKNVSVMCKGNK